MICPHCKGVDTIVVDSRSRNGIVKRRRMCLSCKQRFNTLEIPEEELRVLREARIKSPWTADKCVYLARE